MVCEAHTLRRIGKKLNMAQEMYVFSAPSHNFVRHLGVFNDDVLFSWGRGPISREIIIDWSLDALSK